VYLLCLCFCDVDIFVCGVFLRFVCVLCGVCVVVCGV